ncbi:WG repeat-containing protein [Roseivirga sp. E12]|uniref:WG repeat-containing protein n=1 Tax=Roseivirga sp. E12 TaxID=2819237 RepID=UPI001ABCB485|nr:WG repeat-containing protein [Roseivirga sp. E12]MBO3700785.1 WG repeat-containing protein [Roseivirga sp. E12]
MFFIRQLFFLVILQLCHFNVWADEYQTFRRDGKYGLKNITSGEIVIPPQYEAIGWSDGSFKVINKLIGARQNEKWALINLDGGKVSLHLYAQLTPYQNNLFIVSKREANSILTRYGVINTKGKPVIEPTYVKLEPAGDLLIAAKRIGADDRFGVLNRNGKPIIPFEFSHIDQVDETRFSIRNNSGLSALYTSNGKAITDFQFESIEKLTDQLLLTKSFNKKGILDRTGKLVVPSIYKNIQLSGERVRALPFKKWDLYQGGSFKESYYFDRMLMVNGERFAITSGQQTGVIDQEEDYLKYLKNLSIVTTINEITIVEDVDSKFQGAIDSSGKMILPANFDSVRVLNDVIVAQLKRIDKQDWTVYNRAGNRQNPFKYESFRPLNNGLIKAIRNGKTGLLNSDGTDLSPFIYDAIGKFKNGLAVASYQGSYGVINLESNWIINPYNDRIEIQESIIRVKQGSEWKLIDFRGSETIRSYNRLTSLPIGYSKRTKDGYELYDSRDSLWLEHQYDTIQVIHDDLYGLKRDGRFFFFRPNNSDDIALDTGITVLGGFSEGLITVKKDEQWGQVDERGNLRIANRYEAIKVFSEGLSAVKLIGKWGFIDKDESLVVQPTYDSVEAFDKGLSIVMKNGKFGIIDSLGKSILPEDFTAIDRQKDYIILNSNGVYGLADARGKLIRTPQYDSIYPLTNGYFLIGRDGLKGVINLKGQDIVPLSYEAIEQMGNRFLASEASKWQLIDLK